MLLRITFFLVLIGFIFSGCSKDEPLHDLPQTIQTRTFSLDIPEGWTFIEDQGTDTYIGRIKNKNEDMTIFFDQGRLSFGSLQNVEENSETIYFRRLKINGVPAVIHKEERPHETHVSTRLSVYLDNGSHQNRLYINDSPDDDLVIRIFKTHRFIY